MIFDFGVIMILAGATWGLVGGCDGEDRGHGGERSATQIVKIGGPGGVKGKVLFHGTPPVMSAISNEPCHAGAGSLVEETVVVNENATLKNAIVFLSGVAAGDGSTASPALLDQVNCQYVPHVIGVQTNQPLRIRSSDPTLHNVHYAPQQNPAKNFGMTQPGAEQLVKFAAAEFIRVKCDVHPWMTAYIGVFDSPWFAVTGDDGSFELNGIPAGTYTLAAWHEKFGQQQQEIVVGDERVSKEFIYKMP